MSTLEKAGRIIGLLLPIAVREPDELPDAVAGLSRPQVTAATILMVAFDAERQKTGARLEVELRALDELIAAAADGPAAVLDVARRLDDDELREALVNLVLLHRDLTLAEVSARAAAAAN